MSNLYKDSEGNKQEQYFYATANNQKSWIENFDDYSNHDYHNAAQSDADFAEEAKPVAKGLALLISPIGLSKIIPYKCLSNKISVFNIGTTLGSAGKTFITESKNEK